MLRDVQEGACEAYGAAIGISISVSTCDPLTISEQMHVSDTTVYDTDLIFRNGEVHDHESAPSASMITILLCDFF